MRNMYKIMIVEDDFEIAQSLKSSLESWGYETVLPESFESIHQMWVQDKPDLILMDLNLPGRNGVYWLQKIRQCSNVPILFLSGDDSNANVIAALSQGADDYVFKPFDTTVLITKISALLRRSYDWPQPSSRLECNGIVLNPETAEVSYNGKVCELTKNESRILKALLEQKARPVSRSALMEILWNTDCYIDENTLSVNVNRLRRKLESIGVRDLIQTKKGLGYQVG